MRASQFHPCVGRELVEALIDCGVEIGVVGVMSAVQGFLFDEFPEPFDQIEVW